MNLKVSAVLCIAVGILAGYFLALGPLIILSALGIAGVYIFLKIARDEHGGLAGLFYASGIAIFIVAMWFTAIGTTLNTSFIAEAFSAETVSEFLFR